MTTHVPRRDFLKTTAAGVAAIAAGLWSELPAAEPRSPLEKLNIAGVGTAGMAAADLSEMAGQNIVALADVDESLLQAARAKYRIAEPYFDYRLMLEVEQGKIDAVVVSTPDHSHAPASIMAMKLGKHVYCQKPLTHSVSEARKMAELAVSKNLVTQMGTQIHGSDNYRRVVEIVQSGAIGNVKEAHVICGKGWGGGTRPDHGDPVPPNLHWDLWLGPAPERPYANGIYHRENWRRWWDFGGGTLGDMGCHIMDLVFWALKLKAPVAIAAEGPPVHPETTPLGLIVRYDYLMPETNQPLAVTWYDGDKIPSQIGGHMVPGFGVLFVGDKGRLFADYGQYVLTPAENFKEYQPPARTIPPSIGHYKEWIEACKAGTPNTTCNFTYSGALSEAVLLGNVAYRTGKKIEWDAEKCQVKNSSEANALLSREYRKGWEV